MRVHFIQHVYFEDPGHLLEWTKNKHYSTSFTKTFETISFPQLADFDLLVIMGGPMGVYDENKFPWLKKEKQFINDAITANKKVLGICLGSQLIAEALGSKIYPNKEKEIGWWSIKKVNAKFTKNFPGEFVTFHWHGDTFDLPKNAVRLFSTDVCPNQGFLYGSHVAALQFHPEVTEALISSMIKHEGEELIPASFIQTEEIIKEETPKWVNTNKNFLTEFIEQFLKL